MSDEATGEFIRVQTALAGRYSLERELGRGGMGIVYLARDVALDRLVAIKLLPPNLAGDGALRQRFLNEARTAAKLSHPNIIPIFAVEEVGDFVFFVMAFVDGETLGQRVRSRGALPPSELAVVLREVAWGLAYAHAQGVVHRDIKADNILMERGSGRALVADFGIARVTQNAGVTGIGEILGTAEYMSPEQASGEAVDNRSDIYSLGIVAFYALAGHVPFEGPNVAAILAKQITQVPPPVAKAVDGIPSKLGRAVDKCLEKDPAARFQKAEDLADAIAAALEARRELAVPIRIFIKKAREVSQLVGGVAILTAGSIPAILGFWFSPDPGGKAVSSFFMVYSVLFWLIPVGALLGTVRTLLKDGYGRAELVVAWRPELERVREERSFEYGRRASIGERILISLTALSAVSMAGAAAAGLFGKTSLGGTMAAAGGMVGIFTGIAAVLRYERRTDLSGRFMGRFWNTGVAKWIFKLAAIGLKRADIATPATQRPTELAIGMAVDALFEALPKPTRRQLGDLPLVVRSLEADAMKMRRRVEELNEAVANIESGKRTAHGLATAGALTDRRDALDRDLHAARDAAKGRLADAVTALEGIRLNLLRMTAGAGSVDSLTADLAAAREVSHTVRRLLEGQDEVEAHLK